MKLIIQLLFSLVMSVFIGGAMSHASGIDPVYTIGGGLVISNVIMPAVSASIGSGVLNDVVFKTVYESELLKTLGEIKDSFLARVPNKSHLLEGNTINYTKIGASPKVLINNTTYPIPSAQRTDEGMSVSLKKLTTEGTIITRDEIHNLPYDKKNSVLQQHKEALLDMAKKYSLHAFAPNANATKMPVLATTGEDDGTGRKRLTKADLIKFRRALNDAGVGECDLVLCNEHAEDVMLWSQVFENQYHNIAKGLVIPMYGFWVSQNVGFSPSYNAGTKKALDATAVAGDVKASVAYDAKRTFRAYGDVEMFFTPATAKYHQDEVNFDAYFLGDAMDNEGRGAILSGKVA